MIAAGHTVIDVPCKKLSTQELRHARKDTPQLFGTVIREIYLSNRKTPVYIELLCDPCIQQTEVQQTSWGPDVNVTCVLTEDCRYVVTAVRDICTEQPLIQTEHRTDNFVRYDWAELATNRMMDMQQQLLGVLGEEREKRQQLQEDLADTEQQLSQMSRTSSAQQEQLLRLTTRLTKLEQTVPASSVLQDQVQRMSTQLNKLEHAVKDSSSQQAADKQMVSIRDEHARLTSQMQVLQRDVHAAATQRLPKEVRHDRYAYALQIRRVAKTSNSITHCYYIIASHA